METLRTLKTIELSVHDRDRRPRPPTANRDRDRDREPRPRTATATATATAIWALVVVLSTISSLSAADEKPAATQPPRHTLAIVEVTVYEDRALVTREGEVPVSGAGVETVLVGGLPPSLSETSLRAGLADPNAGRVISVSSETERKAEIQDTRLKAVEDERRTVERAIAEIDDDLARVQVRRAYLDQYEKLLQRAVSERTGGGGAVPAVAEWAAGLKFVREGRDTLAASERDAQKKREALAQKQNDLEAEGNRLRQPEERWTRTAEVSIEAKQAGRLKLRLSYVIEGAAWLPRYDARFDVEKSELLVTYFGEIRQQTGEDWKGAKLALSTARPSVGASRPEILPLRLTAAALQAKEKGIQELAVVRERLAEDVPAEAAGGLVLSGVAPSDRAGLIASATRDSATAATFAVPGLADIPSDKRPHKVPVTSFRSKTQTSFETAPSLARFVYLKARADNATQHPMLAGLVDIYRGSGFIGTSALKFVAPGRPFEVSLGIEEALKVRRAATFDSWTGRGKEKKRGFDIEVANFGEKPESVTILENYPVSDVEEVTVRLLDATTPPTEKDDKDGILKWKVLVAPGEARTVHLEYTITYPKNYTGE